MANIVFAVFYILLFLCAAVAFYNILKIILKVPDERVSKALAGALSEPAEPFLKRFNYNIAISLSRFITINPYKKERLATSLMIAHLNISPELYTAKTLVPLIECAILALLAAIISPFFSFVLIGIGIWLMSREKNKVKWLIEEKQSQIDTDLPRFVTSIVNELEYTHDVLTLLEKHKDDYSEYWSYEMGITIADMRTGNYIAALQRLRSRVMSQNLNDVVNELIMMSQGYDTVNSWHTLEVRFRELGLQELRKQAKLIPDKVHNLSLPLILGMLLIYAVVLGSLLINSIGTLTSM